MAIWIFPLKIVMFHGYVNVYRRVNLQLQRISQPHFMTKERIPWVGTSIYPHCIPNKSPFMVGYIPLNFIYPLVN